MPRVSIITPAYNAEKYLPETIACVRAQTLSDFEWLVVDDGCADRTVELLERAGDPRIRVVSPGRQGLTSAVRNAGAREATGDYFAFIDADDLWEPTCVEEAVEALERTPRAGLYAVGFEGFRGSERVSIATLPPNEEVIPGPQAVERLLHQNFVAMSGVVVPRRVFEELGGFNTDRRLGHSSDLEMWVRIALRYDVIRGAKLLARYRLHAGSMSSAHVKSLESDLAALEVLARNPELVCAGHVGACEARIARVAFGKAVAELEEGDRAAALRSLHRAIKAKPKRPEPYLALLLAPAGAHGGQVLRQIHRAKERLRGKSAVRGEEMRA